MLSEFHILSLVYQKQGQGDVRDIGLIRADVETDHGALFPPVASAPTDIVSSRKTVLPNGDVIRKNIQFDGQEVDPA